MVNVVEEYIVGKEMLKGIKFADDQRMVAQTKSCLQKIILTLSKTGNEHDMNINVKKTKVMRVCGDGSKRKGDNAISIFVISDYLFQMMVLLQQILPYPLA